MRSSVQRRLIETAMDRALRQAERAYRLSPEDEGTREAYLTAQLRSGIQPRIVEFRRLNYQLAQEYQQDLIKWRQLPEEDISANFDQFLKDLSVRGNIVVMGQINDPPTSPHSDPQDRPTGANYFQAYIESPKTNPWSLLKARDMGSVTFIQLIREMQIHSIPIKPFPSLDEMEDDAYERHDKLWYGRRARGPGYVGPRWRVGEGEDPTFLNQFFHQDWPIIQRAFGLAPSGIARYDN